MPWEECPLKLRKKSEFLIFVEQLTEFTSEFN